MYDSQNIRSLSTLCEVWAYLLILTKLGVDDNRKHTLVPLTSILYVCPKKTLATYLNFSHMVLEEKLLASYCVVN
uniref:Uncharacterized protein n=1 Tax=Arundo donax TaxID=35708 RepID=A0A0A9GHT7_ARUDO